MMNKSAIKNYAVWARKELMKQVAQKAFEYGVTETSVPDQNVDSIHGRLLSNQEKNELTQLVSQIKKYGYDHVIEEVAYTWFNRFIALRFMEVNNYLPQRIRIFTNENNEFKPELLNEAIHVELEGLDQTKVFDMIEQNDRDSLYKYLLLCLCNDMKQYLPDMFTSIEDYKALLMPDNLLREDSVLGKLIEDIDEDSWLNQVQIIGWLYQYYNAELKDAVMKKKNYTKDEIPAATQLFTPDWIVRYMTENSLGRLWIDGHPDFDHREWKYYLEEAKQEPEVVKQLEGIKAEHAKLNPEDITVIDPCMGSGHILVYAFDVLMDIYRASGYSDRDAARSFLENNVYGLEIDERAFHLAYFALMMKARDYYRRILFRGIKLNVLEIREPESTLKKEFEPYLNGYADLAKYLVETFKEAKEFGSILIMDHSEQEFVEFQDYLDSLKNEENPDIVAKAYIKEMVDILNPLVRQAILLAKKYDVVITNPPYMAPTAKQKPYVQNHYGDSKSDLFAVFMERCHYLTKKDAYQAMITMHSWMFLSSFEKLRKKLLKQNTIINMAHLGARAFEDIGGEVVQTSSFIVYNQNIIGYKSSFKRLVDYNSQDEKEINYFLSNNLFVQKASDFNKIPGSPIGYWLSKNVFNIFSLGSPLNQFGVLTNGMFTCDNNRFLKKWYEVSDIKIFYKCSSQKESINSDLKWYPYNKGGDFRKWYGNHLYVIDFEKFGEEISLFRKKRGQSASFPGQSYYFKESISWSLVSSYKFGARFYPKGFVFDIGGSSFFPDKHFKYILGFLTSNVATNLLNILNPTMNFQIGDVSKIPLIYNENHKVEIEELVDKCIELSKNDWDEVETSWNFTNLNLLNNISDGLIEKSVKEVLNQKQNDIEKEKSYETRLNDIFIDIYNLSTDINITNKIVDKDLSVKILPSEQLIKNFISYAVGCMFGRYSLDVEGLAFAGGDFDAAKYSSFIPDSDDILPICDEEYFEDDIVTRFIEFVRVVYGSDTLETNLEFIASALGGKGTPREVLRSYFLNDFYKDHCKIYQKRPIYWLFDSGKKNGFKSLVYIHRYTLDLIARMRTGYVHPQQARYRTQMELLQSQIEEATSTSERVRLNKRLKKISEQAAELAKYEEKVHHWADKMEPMDLDDGVKVNYEKFKDLLAKIK